MNNKELSIVLLLFVYAEGYLVYFVLVSMTTDILYTN